MMAWPAIWITNAMSNWEILETVNRELLGAYLVSLLAVPV